jgi:O-antigen/teichoic acid export membrane protein
VIFLAPGDKSIGAGQQKDCEMRRYARLPRVAVASVTGVLLLAVVPLTVLPLAGRQRAEAWVLTVALVVFVPLLALAASAQRHRTFSPELHAAAIVRGIIVLPVGALMVGAVAFGWHQDIDAAASAAAAILIGAGVGLGSRFWWLSRRP